MSAMFKFKMAGGGGFTTPIGAVYDVQPHKKPDKAVVMVLWGGKHGGKSTSQGSGPKPVPMTAVGSWRTLRDKWLKMRAAEEGQDTPTERRSEPDVNATGGNVMSKKEGQDLADRHLDAREEWTSKLYPSYELYRVKRNMCSDGLDHSRLRALGRFIAKTGIMSSFSKNYFLTVRRVDSRKKVTSYDLHDHAKTLYTRTVKARTTSDKQISDTPIYGMIAGSSYDTGKSYVLNGVGLVLWAWGTANRPFELSAVCKEHRVDDVMDVLTAGPAKRQQVPIKMKSITGSHVSKALDMLCRGCSPVDAWREAVGKSGYAEVGGTVWPRYATPKKAQSEPRERCAEAGNGNEGTEHTIETTIAPSAKEDVMTDAAAVPAAEQAEPDMLDMLEKFLLKNAGGMTDVNRAVEDATEELEAAMKAETAAKELVLEASTKVGVAREKLAEAERAVAERAEKKAKVAQLLQAAMSA